MMIVFLKSTVRPCESVMRLHPSAYLSHCSLERFAMSPHGTLLLDLKIGGIPDIESAVHFNDGITLSGQLGASFAAERAGA
jgi:hypothetical protein